MQHYKHLKFFFLLALFSSNTIASTNPSKEEKLPIHITAKEITFENNENKATALGNAVIKRGDSILYAQRVEAYFSKNGAKHKINHIKAFDSVKIETPGNVSTGDIGTYDIEKETIILEGNVTVTDHKNVVRGHYGVMDQKTGTTRILDHNPQDKTSSTTKRVSAILVSED